MQGLKDPKAFKEMVWRMKRETAAGGGGNKPPEVMTMAPVRS